MTRRPVVDNGWYKTLTQSNVELVTEEIRRLTAGGIETVDGRRREGSISLSLPRLSMWSDSISPPGEYVGLDGIELHERWSVDWPLCLCWNDGTRISQSIYDVRAQFAAGVRRDFAASMGSTLGWLHREVPRWDVGEVGMRVVAVTNKGVPKLQPGTGLNFFFFFFFFFFGGGGGGGCTSLLMGHPAGERSVRVSRVFPEVRCALIGTIFDSSHR